MALGEMVLKYRHKRVQQLRPEELNRHPMES